MSHPSPAPERLLTLDELATYLHCSRSAIKRHLERGMPAIDLAIPRLGKRRHRCLRFDPREVTEWLRTRSAA